MSAVHGEKTGASAPALLGWAEDKRGRGGTGPVKKGKGGKEWAFKPDLGRMGRGGESQAVGPRERRERFYFSFIFLFQKPFEIHLKILLNHFEF